MYIWLTDMLLYANKLFEDNIFCIHLIMHNNFCLWLEALNIITLYGTRRNVMYCVTIYLWISLCWYVFQSLIKGWYKRGRYWSTAYWLSWRHDFKNLYGRHHDLVNSYGISVSDDQGCVLLVVVIIYLISSFITYHKILMRVTRRMSLVEQELLILPERPSATPVSTCTFLCGVL